MFREFYIIFNDKTSEDLGIKVMTRPVIPSPTPIYKEYEIPGKIGKEYELVGHEDLEIQVSFNFIDKEDIYDKFRKCKVWINNIKDNKLIFSDNRGYFYRVNYAMIPTNERILKRLCRFTVTFNCEPFAYDLAGQEEIEISKETTIYNSGDRQSKPIIKIIGEGIVNIKINGNELIANVGKEITIDSYLDMSYKEDKTNQNKNVKGKYPVLEVGENTISYTGGIVHKFTIMPNWVVY